MPRPWRENGATAVSMAAVSYTLLVLLGRGATAMLSLEAKLLALSLLWAALYHLQRVLVGKRRCSVKWHVQYGAMAAYKLPTTVAFSAASVLYYSNRIDESTPSLVLGILCMLLTSTVVSSGFGLLFTNMRAYSLRDRPEDCSSFLKWIVFLVFVQWESARISSYNWLELVLILFVMPITVVFEVLFSYYHASKSTLDCETKAVADYMERLKSSNSSTSSPFFDDNDDANSSNSSLNLLDCCRYPFMQRRKDGEWVSIKDLVQQDDLPNDDKDICLSYSLSRLLARRYFEFHCAEEGDDKVRRFVRADLGTRDGYKRAFTIVEVQLAFLHDYLFTASLTIIESGSHYIHVTSFVTLALEYTIWTRASADGLGTKWLHILVTAVMGMHLSWSLLFGLPLLPTDLLAFYWRPIHTAFYKLNCLPDPDCYRLPASLVGLFGSRPNPIAQDVSDPQSGDVYWRNKIGQYSILQDYDRRQSKKKKLVDGFHRIMLSQQSYEFIKHLPEEEEEVDMLELDSMRMLVGHTLHSIDGPPTNGTRSLEINKDKINRARKNRDIADYDWLQTCRQETHTDTILIWHIATCYCDMSLRHSDRQEGFSWLAEIDTFHKVATALSRYCAYLVAFLPEFLPQHRLTTKQVFQRVLQEAQSELGTTPMEEKEKYTKMKELLLPHQHEQRTTFHKGVELGRQLEMLSDDKVRWKVIAEFWAETILYVAPSDNVKVHMEHLAKGGEFITHIWAMLSNAGILKRATGEWHQPPASITTEALATHPLREALSSSIDEASTSSMSFLPRQTSELPTNEKGKQPQILDDIDE